MIPSPGQDPPGPQRVTGGFFREVIPQLGPEAWGCKAVAFEKSRLLQLELDGREDGNGHGAGGGLS